MGRSTVSQRTKIKDMEKEIMEMSAYMRKEDIEILSHVLSLAEKHSNEISDYKQFFAAIIVELYKKMIEYENTDKRYRF